MKPMAQDTFCNRTRPVAIFRSLFACPGAGYRWPRDRTVQPEFPATGVVQSCKWKRLLVVRSPVADFPFLVLCFRLLLPFGAEGPRSLGHVLFVAFPINERICLSFLQPSELLLHSVIAAVGSQEYVTR